MGKLDSFSLGSPGFWTALAASFLLAVGAGCGGGGDGGSGGGATTTSGSGGGSGTVNGCTLGAAHDATMIAEVTVTDKTTWTVPHAACTIVSAGTKVTWNGSFASHPLVGGVTGTADDQSPISQAAASGDSVTVTFPDLGDFPYFCGAHFGSMQGVVYVR